MKNTSLIVNVALAIALGVLYFLHFSSTPEAQPTKSSAITSTPNEIDSTNSDSSSAQFIPDFEVANSKVLSFPIAYVNLDTIFEKYDLIRKRAASIERKHRQKVQVFEQEQKELEEFYNQLMTSANNGTLTPEQGANGQQTVQAKYQQLAVKEQEIQNDLLKAQAQLDQDVSKNITNYLKEYSEELDYSYVLGYRYGGPVLYKHDSLDITNQVLKGLHSQKKK